MRNTLLIFSILLVLASGCRKEKFTSESEWVLPLLDTRLTLADVIPDSLTSYNPDSSLNIVFQKQYGISNLSDIVQVPDRVETMEVSLSNLTLDDRAFTDTLTLKEIYPASVFLDGQYTVLDAQNIQPNEGTVVDVTEQFFTQATFLEGFIDITIHNDLPVEAELLEFELRNDDDKEVIVDGAFYNLAPYDSVSESYSLAGKTVDGVMEMLVQTVKTKASEGAVQIDVSKGLRIAFAVRGLKPKEATAIFPAQNLVERKEETKYDFGGAELTELQVSSGYILMKVESSIEETIVLDYSIPRSEDYNKKSIQKTFEIPGAVDGKTVTVEERFPVENFNLYLWGKTNLNAPLVNHIYSELIASIKYTGIERTLSLDDKIKIEFGLVDVKAKKIFGDPGYHEFNLNDTLDIDFLRNISGGLSLEDATLDLELFNSFGVELSVDVNQILGKNGSSNQDVLLSSPSQLGQTIIIDKVSNATPNTPVIKKIVLDKSNSNLKPFIENMPNKIVADITTKVRPNGTINLTDFAYDFSEVRADMTLKVPLKFGVNELVIASTDSISLFEGEELESIKEAKLTLLVQNDFPISAILDLEFITPYGDVITPSFSNNNNLILGAVTDPQTGKSAEASESELTISLTREQVIQLQDANQVGIKIRLNTKDARRYSMFVDYGISVKIIGDVIYENKI